MTGRGYSFFSSFNLMGSALARRRWFWVFLTASLFLFSWFRPLRNQAGPLLPPVDSSVVDPALGAWHFLRASQALEKGECARMRAELKQAVKNGYVLDSELAKDWGFRCGQPLEDGVNFSLKLSALAVAESGTRAAAAVINHQVFIFDLPSSRALPLWNPGLSEVSALDLSDDGKLLAVAGGRKVLIREIDQPDQVWTRDFPEPVSALSFSPQGEKLAVGFSRYTTDADHRPLLFGNIHVISRRQQETTLAMKSVPGNPAELTLTAQGKYVVAWCWPERYTYATISWLCAWDAETGERKFCRKLNTSSLFSAHLSREGRVLAYACLRSEILAQHKNELDSEGRPYDVSNLTALSWLLDPESYRATALQVFTGKEAPLISGLYVLALDSQGQRAVVMDRGGVVKLEEINAGRTYEIKLPASPATAKFPLLASLGLEGRILVMGRANSDLTRFGWFPQELAGPPPSQTPTPSQTPP